MKVRSDINYKDKKGWSMWTQDLFVSGRCRKICFCPGSNPVSDSSELGQWVAKRPLFK